MNSSVEPICIRMNEVVIGMYTISGCTLSSFPSSTPNVGLLLRYTDFGAYL